MTLLDGNVLIYAVNADSPHHRRSKASLVQTHLAALAIEHGARLCSTDRDFASFPGLRWLNPLQ